MKRRMVPVCIMVLFLFMIFVGCGSKNGSEDGNGDKLTKARWVDMLGNCFGYTEAFEETNYFSDITPEHPFYHVIQACAEWDVLEESKTFNPEESVTWRYILETSVRAIGLDNINSSTKNVEVTEDNLVEFFTGNIARIEVSDLDAYAGVEDAGQVLQCAYQYYVDLVPSDLYQVKYNDKVCEVSADAISLKGDGITAIINDGTTYEPGEILYVQPGENSAAYAIKVNVCEDNQLKYETADMEAVFEEMIIRGEYDATIIGAEAADYVSLVPIEEGAQTVYPVSTRHLLPYSDSIQPYIMQAKVDHKISKTGAEFRADYKGIELLVSLTGFRVNTDVDFSVRKGLRKANVTVAFDDKIEVRYENSAEKTSGTIPLGNITLNVGSTPFQIEMSLVLNVGLNGEASLTYTSKVTGKVQYAKGKSLSTAVSNDSQNLDFHAQVTLTAEPTIKVDLKCLGNCSIANIKVTSGVVAVATTDVDLLGNQPTCVDLYLYVPLRWAVNEDGCLMTTISNKLKKSKVVWDSENSAITKSFHWEDLELVEKCTRGEEQEVVTAPTDESGQPYEEYNLFDFEEIMFESIELTSINVYLQKGETFSLGIIGIPSGYTLDDLEYSFEEDGICEVSKGTITGISSGSTILKISTPDGKYSVYLTVIVAADYNDTSGFEAL